MLLLTLLIGTACGEPFAPQARTYLPTIYAGLPPESPLPNRRLVATQHGTQVLYLPQIAAASASKPAENPLALDPVVEASTATIAPLPPPGKFGVDALHPIDIRSGTRSQIAIHPEIVAGTGADWVRLNFILGPWSSVDDGTHYHGQGWVDTYRTIIDGYRRQGLHIYALVSYEAMPEDPIDALRTPPPTDDMLCASSSRCESRNEWVDAYIDTLLAILDRFADEIEVVETLNEPDDWHGGANAWIHPAWLAAIHQRVYPAIKANPRTQHITLVSGPLQGLQNNHNRAADYLLSFYREGKTRFQWGEEETPFPFDGVGYHLYLHDRFYYDAEQHQRALRSVYERYVGDIERVIQEQEGQMRPVYISEIGFPSRPDDEELQAQNLQTVLTLIENDPNVTLGFWFAIQDFRIEGNLQTYGLYREGDLSPDNRKPAYAVYQTIAQNAPPLEAP